jgi:hypothetical protein
MKREMTASSSNARFKPWIVLLSAMAAVLTASQSQALVVIYAQDFEESPAADEFASGDFDPVPVVDGSEGMFFESTPIAVQVVDTTTIVNGSPSGAVQVVGNNSLKYSAAGAPEVTACCQHYQIFPLQQGGLGSTESILTFSIYGVPSTDGIAGPDNRLVEMWANEGGALGNTGGPDFIFEFRFDEDGTVKYDSAGGWDTAAGVVFPLNQWNTIVVSSRVDGASQPFVTLSVNGTVYDNGGTGYGDSIATPAAIDRYQFSVQFNAGPGAGLYYDDFFIEDPLAIPPPTNAYSVVQADIVSLTLDGLAGQDYKVEFTTDPAVGNWTATEFTFEGKAGATSVFDSSGGDNARVYRIAVQ